MAVETDAERLAFLNPDEFGCEAAYTPKKGGGPRPIFGIFEAPGSDWNPNRWPGGHQIAMQEGAHIVSTAPRFECRVSDLDGGGRRGDGLAIAGTAYRVVKRDPDGTGMTVLTLEEVGEVEP